MPDWLLYSKMQLQEEREALFRMYINCENVTDTEMCIDESTSDTDNSMDWIFGREDEEDDTEQQEETTETDSEDDFR